ncbi:ABC transporter B family member 15-like [Phaseolus vulgaris]|uniref:ABC transporter B family member 15-like n=1 Tax=Phaseolus vulgaris TaxID=3885 RepID=UPI0035CAABC7
MNDALNFLNRAKDVFWNEREKYDMLIQILKDYKAERITSEVVAARVKELLKGHSSLILRFNAFLPKEHEIKLKDEPSQELVRLVDNIKERFKDDEHLYQSFLMSIKTYKEDKRKTTCDLHGELAVIFKDHQDLLKEFTRKFPNYDKVEENVVEDEKPTLSIPKWKQTYLGCFIALLFCTIMCSVIFVYFLSCHDEITRKTKMYSFCFLGLVVISFIANVFHQPYNIICMKEYLIKRVSKILPIGDGWFVQKETFRCDLCHKFVQENVVMPLMGEKMGVVVQTICAVVIGFTMGLMFTWRVAIAMTLLHLIIIVCFNKRGFLKIMPSKNIKNHDD